MDVQDEIHNYIAVQPEPKRSDMQTLHTTILRLSPDCKLWFLNGRDETGKVVSNPNIGYGSLAMKYADGSTRDFYRVGLSANSSGISVYVRGIEDKTYLKETFGKDLGKASITGYCIRFKKLDDINVETLKAAIKFGFERGTNE